jgi:hypothetical protein
MKIVLTGIVPEQIKITCTAEAGVVFMNNAGQSERLIHIKPSGSIALNGSEDVTPELIGLALIQWANKYHQVIKK